MNRRYVIYTAESKAAHAKRIREAWARRKAAQKK
jgi:hypothetical protein